MMLGMARAGILLTQKFSNPRNGLGTGWLLGRIVISS